MLDSTGYGITYTNHRNQGDFVESWWFGLLVSLVVLAAIVGLIWFALFALSGFEGRRGLGSMGDAASANRRCAEHGGVNSTDDRGGMVTCKDGTTHSIPVFYSELSDAEYARCCDDE